ncbi:MAG: GNAT family N-acetyltransferase [Anaerolineales bacterium]|nr:GNAT family N-acetyltransferase [Anaerolineales bacterium]
MASEDAAAQARWENDLAITIPLGDEAYMVTGLDKVQEQVAGAIKNQSHVFSIVDLESDHLIGRGMLFSVNYVNRSAMLGIVIGEPEFQNRGYGVDATRLLLDFAFNLLNLNSVMLGAFAFNERAIAAYRKVGFREIGRRREARLIGGRYHDAILMDILACEFTGGFLKLPEASATAA